MGPARRPASLVAACIGVLVMAGGTGPEAQSVPAAVQRVLSEQFGFSAAEISSIARGKAVARGLETHDDREVSAVGAVRVGVPPSFYVERMRDIVRFKRHEAVLQIGVFGASPAASDLARLTLDRDDLHRLRHCSPSQCEVNLSPEAVARVRQGVTWGSTAGHQQATRQFRAVLAALVDDYRARGDTALMTYVQDGRQLSTAAEFRDLATSPPSLLDAFPSLRDHIMRYPQATTPAVQDIIYWSKEKVGPRVVTSVTHMAVARLPTHAAPAVYAAASRQIYGTQLYEASLGLTLLLQDPAEADGLYLVYANRSRVDALGGIFGVIKRGVVRSRARAAVPGTLERAKLNAERRYAEQSIAGSAR